MWIRQVAAVSLWQVCHPARTSSSVSSRPVQKPLMGQTRVPVTASTMRSRQASSHTCAQPQRSHRNTGGSLQGDMGTKTLFYHGARH